MIKILSTPQIRALDAYTIANEPVASIDLMERACRAFTAWFTEKFNALNKVGIVCGTGNNGGDGLGIARLLKDWGYPVKVWIVRGAVPESNDFTSNLKRLKETPVEILEIATTPDLTVFDDCDILIDAVFGSGLSRAAEGIYEQAIAAMNQAGTILRIAVDIPSGLMADKPSSGPVVQADYTVSFQLPKLAFFFPENHRFTGEWVTVDIGLSKSFLRSEETLNFYVSRKAARKLLKRRGKFDHKGNFGHALIVAGSYGKMGAAVLASHATLRTGAGLLTVYTPQCGYTILQTTIPEAMVQTDLHEYFLTAPPDLRNISSAGIGPGIGQEKETAEALGRLFQALEKPAVLDADALNILATRRELIHLIPQGSILTPHPKEFERLVGEWKNSFERLEKQKQLARQIKSVIIVKGAYTSIASPDGMVYFNSTGNPGMATGGSGDVLTGILTGLLAQQYNAVDAAVLGVYIHGLAGDIAAGEVGKNSLIASDLIKFLPAAFQILER